VEPDARLAVGSGVTDACTRTNQTKPRTGEAIREDESYLVAVNLVCERNGIARFVTMRRQVNQENPRGGRRPSCCGNTRFLTPEAKMAFRITYGSYVTGPEPNQGEGPCGDEARRSAEEPEAAASGAEHIRAVMRSAIANLPLVASLTRAFVPEKRFVTAGEGYEPSLNREELDCRSVAAAERHVPHPQRHYPWRCAR
jgi:hypothetical protein